MDDVSTSRLLYRHMHGRATHNKDMMSRCLDYSIDVCMAEPYMIKWWCLYVLITV